MTQKAADSALLGLGARWSTVRRFAGYGAASTLSLYLVVKVIWVLTALLSSGPKDPATSTADWVTLNVVTVGMSAIGVALGLALAQRWGRRIPAPPLIFLAWTGAGFLIPMVPYMVVSAVLGAAGISVGGEDGGASGGGQVMPTWEMVFISVGFAGMAVGLAIALPIYMRERWPDAFVGRLGNDLITVARSRPRDLCMVRAALAVSSLLGLLWLYWAIGGTLGLDLTHREMDLNGRLLTGNSGIWAFIGVWSIWVVTTRRHVARLPLWAPMSLAFAASGSLFAWSCWKLSMAVLRPGGYMPPEHPVVTLVQHALAIGAGIAILAGLVRTYRDRAADRSAQVGPKM
jgi:hypothetical protein